MSSRSRKFPGLRRVQRARHWTRWYREGILEAAVNAGARRRRIIGGAAK
jgi:hypothetical protein